ncbi:MAG: peroxiredoxin [Acidobacteriota bacterium]|nr:peroxiredoxin [Acidobacteriota bacterium]
MVEIGKEVPEFSLPASGDQTISLSSLRGKKVVIYFYPKDNTPGCTKESIGFGENYAAFQEAGAEILGISRDSVKSHNNFKAKYDFPFDLLSDKEETLCKLFDVIKEKNMYGKKVMGIERSTFVIDENGVLVQEWRKVKVPGHVDAVLEYVKGM